MDLTCTYSPAVCILNFKVSLEISIAIPMHLTFLKHSHPPASLATQASLAQSRSYCCYELFPICSPSIKYLSFLQAVVCVLQHSMGANADSSVNPTSPGNAYFKLSISLHTLMTRTPHLFHFFIR